MFKLHNVSRLQTLSRFGLGSLRSSPRRWFANSNGDISDKWPKWLQLMTRNSLKNPYDRARVMVMIGVTTAVYSGLYLFARSEVPITQRKQLDLVPCSVERKMALREGEKLLQQHHHLLLASNEGVVNKVKGVGMRLLAKNAQLLKDIPAPEEWKFHVMNEDGPTAVAFGSAGLCIVSTGLFYRIQTEDQLAAVLAHEIAHGIAHHACERVTEFGLYIPPLLLAGYCFHAAIAIPYLLLFGAMMPRARAMEHEADVMSLKLLHNAGYSPKSAADALLTLGSLGTNAHMSNFKRASLATHPTNIERRERVEAAIKTMFPHAS